MRKATIVRKKKRNQTKEYLHNAKQQTQKPSNKNKEDIMTLPNEHDTPIQDYEDDEIKEMQDTISKNL